MKRRNRTWTCGILTLILVGGIALSGCLGGRTDATAEAAEPHGHGSPHEEAVTMPPADGPVDVRLTASTGTPENELGIAPNPLRVPLGKVVELTVRNDGAAPHTFTIHKYGIDTGVLDPGEARTFAFRAKYAGDFEVMCDVAGHYQAGMRATMTVA